MPNNQTLLYAITLEFTLPLGTPPSRESVEHEVQLFLDEMQTNPPQVTWEHLPQTSPTGWPEVRFVGSLRDINNVICQWNGGDGQGIQETLEHVEPVYGKPNYTHLQSGHIVDHDELVEILEVVARSDLDMADMLGRKYGLSTQELQYVQTGDRSELDDYCNGKEI